MARIKVAVSPFFGGEDWTDELTNITFSKNARGLNVYSIPEELDLTNIRKAIHLNALILVEGNIGEFNEVEDIVIEKPAKEEVVEEVVVETAEVKVEEVVVETAEVKVEEVVVETAEVKVEEEKKSNKKPISKKK